MGPLLTKLGQQAQEIKHLKAELDHLEDKLADANRQIAEATEILADGSLWTFDGQEIPTTLVDRAKNIVMALTAEADEVTRLTKNRKGKEPRNRQGRPDMKYDALLAAFRGFVHDPDVEEAAEVERQKANKVDSLLEELLFARGEHIDAEKALGEALQASLKELAEDEPDTVEAIKREAKVE